MKRTVKITTKLIKAGKWHFSNQCPVQQALTKTFPEYHWNVGVETAVYCYPLSHKGIALINVAGEVVFPKRIAQLIRNGLRLRPVKPTQFTINIPL